MAVADVLKQIQESRVKYVDLRFTDTHGKEQHVTVPSRVVDERLFLEGKMFDGSSIAGWKSINESDMILLPEAESAVLDPFFQDKTLNIRCDVVEASDGSAYKRDPRSIAKRAEQYLVETGLGDTAYFGPENEFFVFDDVRFASKPGNAFFEVNSVEAHWNTDNCYEGGNMGHRPGLKGGYFPVPPVDSLHDLRAAMSQSCEAMGVMTEVHHHEVASSGQCEIGTVFNTLVRKADEVQIYKYAIHNTAHMFGKTATFMPKPIVGDNGSGMHVHQSIFKAGENQFAGDRYGGLSELALYYIGGIFKHARAINAFTNASTNSYKRLVPGFEAPVLLAYSARNRSASCRIPFVTTDAARRIEIRFPDSTANPYLAFTAMLMAGLDGIKNKIDPGVAMDHDLYDFPSAELSDIPTVAPGLDYALDALDKDREFLTAGDVFSDDAIDAYLQLKQQEVDALRINTHPIEFQFSYSC